jgi:hypothetical protein
MMMKRLLCAVSVVMSLAFAGSAFGDLMAWYGFEGDVNDSSGNGHDGIAYGGPGYAIGKSGLAMDFDGLDDYVEITPFKYTSDTGEFSLTLWFNVRSIEATPTNNGFPYLFNHGMTNRSNNISVYFRSAEGDQRTHTRLQNPAKPDDVRGSTGPLLIVDTKGPETGMVDGQWHMYALTSSAVNGGTVYMDGMVMGTNPDYKGELINLTDMIVFGRRGYQGEASRYFGGPEPNDGMLDDVALWNEALTPAAINRLYRYGMPVPAMIIVVSDAIDKDADGVQDDQGLVDWLTAEGHTVDFRLDYWNVLDPNKVAELEAADLIIISRSANTADYAADAAEITQWNALTTPILDLHAYTARNNRWKWIDSGTATSDTGSPLLQVVDPNHPVFAGLTLTASDPNDPNSPRDLISVVDPNVGAGITSFIASLDMGNGKLLAKAVTGDYAWIAEWQPGVEFYAGSGQIAGGRRLLFCAGTQEVGATLQGAFNLTAEGQEMLRNAIAYLLAQAVEPQTQVSEQ